MDEPQGLLFLCVANSARSQMAEGLARSKAPPGVQIYSAGSKPTLVRQEAVTVLREVGIDISRQRAKPISAVPLDRVATIITLCEDEVCPAGVEGKERLHWPHSDPATVEDKAHRLAAFRKVRDQLTTHIDDYFAQMLKS